MYIIFDEEQRDYVKVEGPDHSLTYTYADYLEWKFKERLELFRGKIFKMAAANMNHRVVGGNLYNQFYNYLKRKTCRVFVAAFDLYRRRPTGGPMRPRTKVQHQRNFYSINPK